MRASLPLVAAGFAIGLVLTLGLGVVTAVPDTAVLPSAQAEPLSDCAPAPVAERAAQVLIAGLPHVLQPNHPLVADLGALEVGGVLISKGNVRNAAQVRRLVAALRLGSGRPPIVATDEEPGRVSSFGEVLGRFSSARTLARKQTPEDVEAFGRQLGVELRNLGMDVDFGPVADVDGGPSQGVIGDRSFSGDPRTAAAYALAFSRGLWSGGVLPAPKHFPGHGRSRVDDREGLGVVHTSLRALRATDLVPFRAQIRSGVRAMMVGHVAYDALDPGIPASLSPRAYALLRGLGFRGVAVTAALDDKAISERWDLREAPVAALAAGADALLVTDGGKALLMRDAIVQAVAEGRLSDARLAQAAGRMMALKGHDPREMTCPSALT